MSKDFGAALEIFLAAHRLELRCSGLSPDRTCSLMRQQGTFQRPAKLKI